VESSGWPSLLVRSRTLGRGLSEFLLTCEQQGVDPVAASRADVAVFVRDLTSRPSLRGVNVVDSGAGLANATIQQRLVPVRLFYDFLMEEGLRESNPVGRGRYTPGLRVGAGAQRGLVPRLTKLPWIPGEDEWLRLLEAARGEPVRNRVMLALAYDAALRREELCSLRTDDVDPGRRMLRIRAETTKNRLERMVPYSASTGALLQEYLVHRAGISRARGLLFLSESRRNHAQPLTLWTWSKVVRRIAVDSGVERFSTHTIRHLCLTDLARMGWEVHAIAAFAGHRHADRDNAARHPAG
jgi:integrase/recombinase XerD